MAGLADLPDLCARVSAALTAAQVPHAVSGALALGVHGFVRATRVIDILVVVPSIRLPEVFEIVRRFGFHGEDRDLIHSFRERAVAELTAGPASIEILAPALPYHREVLGRAKPIDVAGVPVPFVTAEDLIVLKMLWLRDKDRADVRGLLAAARTAVDRPWVRAKLAALLPAETHVVETFDRLAAEVDSL
jgi:hypothetical protein